MFRGGSNTRQVSRGLEYAFGDFSISQVAKVMGRRDDGKKVSWSFFCLEE